MDSNTVALMKSLQAAREPAETTRRLADEHAWAHRDADAGNGAIAKRGAALKHAAAAACWGPVGTNWLGCKHTCMFGVLRAKPSGQRRWTRAAWGSAPGAYVTIRPGGPLDGVVTLTRAGSEGRVIIDATWGSAFDWHSTRAERGGHAAADKLAQAWAEDLAAGRAPVAVD